MWCCMKFRFKFPIQTNGTKILRETRRTDTDNLAGILISNINFIFFSILIIATWSRVILIMKNLFSLCGGISELKSLWVDDDKPTNQPWNMYESAKKWENIQFLTIVQINRMKWKKANRNRQSNLPTLSCSR